MAITELFHLIHIVDVRKEDGVDSVVQRRCGAAAVRAQALDGGGEAVGVAVDDRRLRDRGHQPRGEPEHVGFPLPEFRTRSASTSIRWRGGTDGAASSRCSAAAGRWAVRVAKPGGGVSAGGRC